jgi:hypothetical protein
MPSAWTVGYANSATDILPTKSGKEKIIVEK